MGEDGLEGLSKERDFSGGTGVSDLDVSEKMERLSVDRKPSAC